MVFFILLFYIFSYNPARVSHFFTKLNRPYTVKHDNNEVPRTTYFASLYKLKSLHPPSLQHLFCFRRQIIFSVFAISLFDCIHAFKCICDIVFKTKIHTWNTLYIIFWMTSNWNINQFIKEKKNCQIKKCGSLILVRSKHQ